MAYEQKDNSGSLFKNDKREKDTHAHARGKAMIEGVEYYVDAWTNESASGTKYQSLKFKRVDAASNGVGGGGGAPRSAQPASQFDNDLDDVPFITCNPALEARVQ